MLSIPDNNAILTSASSVENVPDIDLSIIIALRDSSELSKQCLARVLKHTIGSYEVILINDASLDGVAHLPAELLNSVRVLSNETAQGYSVSYNRAAAIARGKTLCLLTSECLVTPHWNEAPLALLAKDPQIAVVGNKHISPDTKLLTHCGVMFRNNGTPEHLHAHGDPETPAVNYERDVPAVSFTCAFIRSQHYSELGALDERYRSSYQDIDLCHRATRAGYRVRYTPASRVFYAAQVNQVSEERGEIEERDFVLFSSIWQGYQSGTFELWSERDSQFNRQANCRAESNTGIHLAIDTNEQNAFTWAGAELALALERIGQPVSLPRTGYPNDSFEKTKQEALSRLQREIPFSNAQVKFTHYWDAYLKRSLSGAVDLELYCTNYRFRSAEHLDPWSRHVKLNANKKLAVGEFGRQALLDIGVPEEDIRVVPLGYSTEVDEQYSEYVHQGSGQSDLQIFLMTNSFDLRRYGTDLLIEALGEHFSNDDPIVLHIRDYGQASGNGDLRQWIAEYPNFPRVVFHDTFLPKHDLLALYTKMDVLVAPFRGEGFGMKIIDAMALGVCVMMPHFGGVSDYAQAGSFLALEYDEVPVGQCYDTQHSFVSKEAYWCEVKKDDLVQKIRVVLENRTLVTEIGHKGRQEVFGSYSWDKAAHSLCEAVEYFQTKRADRLARSVGPSKYRLSVLIPTKERVATLARTLDGYVAQTEPAVNWELVIVNDHGDYSELEALIAKYSERLSITLLDSRGTGRPRTGGPGAARNYGLYHCAGEVVLITGDDIVPAPDLIATHLQAHELHPNNRAAFVGHIAWHPECGKNWLMDHVVQEGGQQFNFSGMTHLGLAPYDRFYTSNVSVKRHFLLSSSTLFSEAFRLAAFEDIELSYRLHLRDMELRYLETAIGYHLHEMDLNGFLNRQNRVGQMLAVLHFVQPSCVPHCYRPIFGVLESFARIPEREQMQEDSGFFEAISAKYKDVVRRIELLHHVEPSSISAQFLAMVDEELRSCRSLLFNILCGLSIRRGLACEWAQSKEQSSWAYAVATMYGFRSMFVPEMRSVDGSELAGELTVNERESMQSDVRVLYQEIEKLQTSMNDDAKAIDRMQQWISDFSIIDRAKNKLSSLLSSRK